MKDNFSSNSDNYLHYRPEYPDELFQYIKSNVQNTTSAWDCATGNGQVASRLSDFFNAVEATDLSENQVLQAKQKKNVNYSVQLAEKTNFSDSQFDLVTVGQALHWFNFEEFFNEAKRVLKPDGLFVAFGYGLNTVSNGIDEIVSEFYYKTIGPYWDEERKHIEAEYNSIHFPFRKVEKRRFIYSVEWSADHYLGYLNTWSAVKHFQRSKNFNPVDSISNQLREFWGNEKRQVSFSIFLISAFD